MFDAKGHEFGLGGIFGVIFGVSRCIRCGCVAREDGDFPPCQSENEFEYKPPPPFNGETPDDFGEKHLT